jgi:uncharacterized membrane protein YbhN (UPF0104 family)
MPKGSDSGAAYREERLPRGRAILVICLLSALSWAIVIGIMALLYVAAPQRANK